MASMFRGWGLGSIIFVGLLILYATLQPFVPKDRVPEGFRPSPEEKTTEVREEKAAVGHEVQSAKSSETSRPVPKGQDVPSILQVTDIQVCRTVRGKEPVGAGTSFPDTIKALYCYTLVEGAARPTTIRHTWYHQGRETASVPLSVEAGKWRTWSSKRMATAWNGQWRVEVTDAAGAIIGDVEFELVSSKDE